MGPQRPGQTHIDDQKPVFGRRKIGFRLGQTPIGRFPSLQMGMGQPQEHLGDDQVVVRMAPGQPHGGDGGFFQGDGLGNLIVGYDEVNTSTVVYACSDGNDADQASCEGVGEIWSYSHKSGSHYLVTGSANNYSQYGGIVAGDCNFATNSYSTVTGGIFNIASGGGTSVSGSMSSVSGGKAPSVSGQDDWQAGALFEDN
jgi:hypothetical protein